MCPSGSPQNLPQNTPQQLAGRTIRMMREAHRLGLRETAALINVSASHLSRVESGERSAGDVLVKRLAEVLATLPAKETAS